MKILVTGSHGSLGRAFIGYLNERGIAYCTFDRQNPENTESDFDSAVNFAGLTPHSVTSGNADMRVANVASTEHLILYLKGKKLSRLVHIGTSAEYGPSPRALSEKSPPRPRNEYGKTKLEQSQLIEKFAKESKVKTFNLRVFNLLGIPRDPSRERKFIDEHILQSLASGANPIVVSNAKDTRDYVDLLDVFDAILAALTTKKGSGYELINIGTGKATSLEQLVSLFASEMNRKVKIRNTARTSDRYVADASKASRILGWRAKKTIAAIVRDTVGGRKKVLIVGAGKATEMVLDELGKDPRSDIIAIGIVDDNTKKKGSSIRGVKVLGTLKDIPRLCSQQRIDQILISVPSAGSDVAARVASLAPTGTPIKVLPSISSVILGSVDLSYVRDIDAGDIVGRPLIKSDQERIIAAADGKTFLITGGAGSIGSEITRQLFDSRAKKIVVLDASEEGVFNLSEELKQHAQIGRPELVFRIGNIRDRVRLEEVANETQLDVIIHAAAYKHVPLMEENPGEAKKTNEEGTQNLLDLAVERGIHDFVLVSTDKAVNPPNIMGKTKRAAELAVKQCAKEHPEMRLIAVRFGNVLNSSGSMLPTFLRQIRTRSPLTVTHKEVTRYFMSIPEAASLVLTSWIIGKNGQILLLDMGRPMKILDFAEKLIRMHGLVPYKDIPITEIGLRPGEKLHEELAYDPSRIRASSAPRIFIAEDLDS